MRARPTSTPDAGCIHLFCRGCGHRMLNVRRADYDPPAAVVADVLCAECATGAMEPPTFYFDANGSEITGDPARAAADTKETPRG